MQTDTIPTTGLRQTLHRLLRDEDPRQILRNWRWILGFTRQHWLGVSVLTLLGLISSVLNLTAAVITKNLIGSIISMDLQRLVPMTILMVLSAGLGVLFQSFSARYSAKLSTAMHQQIQKLTFERIINGAWLSTRRYATGDLLNRFASDISNVSGCAMTFLPSLIVQLFTMLGTLGLILFYDPIMALICVISTPVLFLASRSLLRRQHAYTRRLRETSSGMSAFQSETFRNLDTIKSFGIEDAVSEQMDRWQQKNKDIILEHNAFTVRTNALMTSLGTLVQYTAIAYCIIRLWQGHLILDTMTFFLQQRGTLQSAFSGLIGQIPRLLSGSVSAERIRELTEQPQDPAPADSPSTDRCHIRLENVSAAYEDGVKVLDGICLTADPGDIIALVGPSGEGKTTLLRLLLGLMQPQSGIMELTDDQGRVFSLGPKTRRYFSSVPQGKTLLAGTIAENLRLVNANATDEEIIAALEGACAWEFVSQMPDTIHTQLGEGGIGLSEGQAQRIAIARASPFGILMRNSVTAL